MQKRSQCVLVFTFPVTITGQRNRGLCLKKKKKKCLSTETKPVSCVSLVFHPDIHQPTYVITYVINILKPKP